MTIRLLSAIFVLILAPSLADAQSCEMLAKLSLPHVTITSAQPVAAGAFVQPQGRGGRGGGVNPFATVPAFCRVAGSARPAPESDIRFEVWLPASGWNGKLQTVGNGGYAGAIGYGALATAVQAGYAAASTDTGHTGGDPAFAAIPDKLLDFAHRAIHETTVAAKAIVATHYGNGPRLSYFNGCSTGGRQALTAAQRYPADFDGIVAGAPANSTVRMTAMQLFSGNAVRSTPAAALPEPARQALHAAAVAACDAKDGVADGVIENPLACRIDASKAGLTREQAQAASRIYEGPGRVFPGLAPGSELGWNGLSGDEPFGYALGMWRNVIFKDQAWDPKALDVDVHVAKADAIVNSSGLQAIDPNLKPFFDRGGKLLMYHGWNDPLISPYNSVNYYRSVLEATKNADSIRLFLMPGVNHCAGGPGTDTWDKAQVLDQWRDGGRAPSRVVASHQTEGRVDKTRPLCAFPQVAVYKGSGSTDEAASFDCR
jgi:feruloyl esterase